MRTYHKSCNYKNIIKKTVFIVKLLFECINTFINVYCCIFGIYYRIIYLSYYVYLLKIKIIHNIQILNLISKNTKLFYLSYIELISSYKL